LKRSHPSNSEVKNERSHTSAPLICLHGVDREHFIFLFFSPIKTERLRGRKIYNVRVSKRDFLCQYYVQTFPLLPEQKLKSLKH
jgi:hypothetical protein